MSKIKFGKESTPQPGMCENHPDRKATHTVPRKRYQDNIAMGPKPLCDQCHAEELEAQGKPKPKPSPPSGSSAKP